MRDWDDAHRRWRADQERNREYKPGEKTAIFIMIFSLIATLLLSLSFVLQRLGSWNGVEPKTYTIAADPRGGSYKPDDSYRRYELIVDVVAEFTLGGEPFEAVHVHSKKNAQPIAGYHMIQMADTAGRVVRSELDWKHVHKHRHELPSMFKGHYRLCTARLWDPDDAYSTLCMIEESPRWSPWSPIKQSSLSWSPIVQSSLSWWSLEDLILRRPG